MKGKDPRKLSAFESGMRGAEKPKVQPKHGGTLQPDGPTGGEKRQAAGAKIGDPEGVDQPAYNSGMRGNEKPKQKSADAATKTTGPGEDGGKAGGESKQGPRTVVGKPEGHADAAAGKRSGLEEGALRGKAGEAYKLGIPGNNTEDAAEGDEGEGPYAEEDDTHINVRIPKASLKRKAPGLQGN